VLVVLNFGAKAAVELTRTPALDAVLAGRASLTDLLDDRPVQVAVGAKTVTVRMAAETAHVLTPEGG
jgi:hypothetical protein